MNFYSYFLLILPTAITAWPANTPRHHRSTDIERIKLGKRLSPICSETCGTVANVIDCLPVLMMAQEAANSIPEGSDCARNGAVNFVQEGSDCVISFAGHGSAAETCISNTRLAGEAEKVFFDCIDPSSGSDGVGGCVDLEDAGHVCVRNINATACF